MFRSSGITLTTLLLAIPALAEYPTFPGTHFDQGKSIWIENCEGCHAYGIAGAPEPAKPEKWYARVEQGPETLYLHAIEGFFGPKGTMMPERGGNLKLSDEQVRAAVDYMVRYATGVDLTLSQKD